jgi:DNA modification methylase
MWRFLGMEIHQQYVDLAEKRIASTHENAADTCYLVKGMT